MKKLIIVVAITSTFILAACERKETTVVPVAESPTTVAVPVPVIVPGPKGDTGAKGASGATGATGASGASGSTTIIVPPASSEPAK